VKLRRTRTGELMRSLICIAVVLLVAAPAANAHPGSGIAVDARGRVFVTMGPFVVRIDTNGQSRTIVSDPENKKFYQLHHIRRAPDGGLLTASDIGDAIWRFTAEGHLSRFYPGANQDGSLRVGSGGDPFEVDAEGNIYAINSGQFRFTQIFRISPHGRISFVAGGDWGHADGAGERAKFADVHGGSLVAGPDGALYLTDDQRYVRKITREGSVSTLAGGETTGFADGSGPKARFNNPMGLALDGAGHVLVADSANHRIRKIAPDGTASTLAGSGRRGSADGAAALATFTEPTGVAFGPGGDLYVLEIGKERVRRISKDGQVTTMGRVTPNAPAL
jgi:sugar lactone lactonase YvrE